MCASLVLKKSVAVLGLLMHFCALHCSGALCFLTGIVAEYVVTGYGSYPTETWFINPLEIPHPLSCQQDSAKGKEKRKKKKIKNKKGSMSWQNLQYYSPATWLKCRLVIALCSHSSTLPCEEECHRSGTFVAFLCTSVSSVPFLFLLEM